MKKILLFMFMVFIFSVGHSGNIIVAPNGDVLEDCGNNNYQFPGNCPKNNSYGNVTRYFGGIKLGGGGLIRAYSHAAALGIEAAQIVVVFVVLVISYIIQTVFRFSKRDWTLVMSAFVIGVVIPMIIDSEIWNR